MGCQNRGRAFECSTLPCCMLQLFCISHHFQRSCMSWQVSHFPTSWVLEPNSSKQQESCCSAGLDGPSSNSARFKLLKINSWCSQAPTGSERDSRKGSWKRGPPCVTQPWVRMMWPMGDLEKAFHLLSHSSGEIRAISRSFVQSCDGISL